jgi:hypothetical protein
MKKRALKKSKKAGKTAKPKVMAKKKLSAKKKSASKKRSVKKARAPKTPKAVGVVTHFYTNIRVAIVKFNKKVSAGTKLHYKGATTDFVDTVKSMQFDHKEIKTAPQGKQIGIKVKKRVREDDRVYLSE